MKLSIKSQFIVFLISGSVTLYLHHLLHTWLSIPKSIKNCVCFNESTLNSSNTTTSRPPNATVVGFQPTTTVKTEQRPLYIITPTYRRPEQLPELTRFSHTLRLIENVYWIVVEDAPEKSKLVTDFLQRTKLKYIHLTGPMPEEYRKEQFPPKGVSNRNKGLEWIRKNARSGVIYFADDDNTYDLELFEEIRHTKRVSMFPVGLMPHLGVCTPVVEKGKLINFYCGWIGDRKFPIDMAGFAVSVEFLLTRPRAWVPFLAGYEETGFLVSLQPFEIPDIELLASNCTKILVWHTQTKENDEPAPVDLDTYGHTNLAKLGEIMM